MPADDVEDAICRVIAAPEGELTTFIDDPGVVAATAYATAHPAEVAQSILRVVAQAGEAPGTWPAIATWLSWWDPAAASAAVARMTGHSVDAAVALVDPLGYSDVDAWKLVPACVVAEALQRRDSAGEWARDLRYSFFHAWGWAEPKQWEWVAMLLSAPDPSAAGQAVGDFLDEHDWARKDPWPVAYEGQTVPERLLTQTPYAQLYPPSESRVAQAAAEATALEGVIRRAVTFGPDPSPWLTALAEALPGCGTHSCCRMSLFEAELLRRAHAPVAGASGAVDRAASVAVVRSPRNVGRGDAGRRATPRLAGRSRPARRGRATACRGGGLGPSQPGWGRVGGTHGAWVAEGRLLYERLRAVLEPAWTLMWAVHERPPQPVGLTDDRKRNRWMRRDVPAPPTMDSA